MSFGDLKARAEAQWSEFASPSRPVIIVGDGTCGRAAGSALVIDAFAQELAAAAIDAPVVRVGCLGSCYAEPLVEMSAPGSPRACFSAQRLVVTPAAGQIGASLRGSPWSVRSRSHASPS